MCAVPIARVNRNLKFIGGSRNWFLVRDFKNLVFQKFPLLLIFVIFSEHENHIYTNF